MVGAQGSERGVSLLGEVTAQSENGTEDTPDAAFHQLTLVNQMVDVIEQGLA